jgi:hypothetical protein
MSEAFTEYQVSCRRCRYRFVVKGTATEDWAVKAECPSCESWACFTIADTHDPARPDPIKLDSATQQLGELLMRPINEHRGHPALAWMDRVGNGVFEDDSSRACWPVPQWVYRFTRGRAAAYIWQVEGSWFVRGWHPLRSRRRPPDPAKVVSFVAALDRLPAS